MIIREISESDLTFAEQMTFIKNNLEVIKNKLTSQEKVKILEHIRTENERIIERIDFER